MVEIDGFFATADLQHTDELDRLSRITACTKETLMENDAEMMTEAGLRELVLSELRQSSEPVSLSALKRSLKQRADGEKELLDAELETLLATGEIHEWAKSAKDRKIWSHAPGPYFHEKLIEVLSERPLTVSETQKALSSLQSSPAVPKDKIKEYLTSLVEQKQLYPIGSKLFAQDPQEMVREEITRILSEQPAQPLTAAALAKAVSERTKLSVSSSAIAAPLAALVDEQKIFKLKSSFLAEDPARLAEQILTRTLQTEPDRVFSKPELAASLKAASPLSLTGKDLTGMLDKLVGTGHAFRHGKDRFGAKEPVLPPDQTLLRALRSAKQGESDSYPMPLEKLAEACQLSPADSRFVELVSEGKNAFRKEAVLSTAEMQADTRVVLKEDIDLLVESDLFVGQLLSQGLPVGAMMTVEKLAKLAPSQLQKRSREALERRLASETMLPGICWVRVDGTAHLFHSEDLYPKSPQSSGRVAQSEPEAASSTKSPPELFEPKFRDTFDRLDRQRGSNNLVSLVELRRELHTISREAFDIGIWRLRQEGKFSLRPADGRHGISPAEREAGFVESGTLLVYVSRRNA